MVELSYEEMIANKKQENEKRLRLLALTKKLYRGDIKVGDVVSRYTEIGSKGTRKSWKDGTVIYVHPKHNFHTVEFTLDNGNKLRECFQGTARNQNFILEEVE